MIPEEKAVIVAAIAWRDAPMSTQRVQASVDLRARINELATAQHGVNISITLRAMGAHGVRAYNIMRRERWSTTDLAALSWQDVVDTRNAGPLVWATWAIVLQEAGFTPQWVKDLAIYSDFQDAYTRLAKEREL